MKTGITLRTNPLPFCALFLGKKSHNIPSFFSAQPSIKGIILPLRPSFRVRPVCAAPPPVTSPQAQEATKQSGPPFVSDGRADEKAPLFIFLLVDREKGEGFFERPCLLFLSPRPRSICPGKSSHGEKGGGRKGRRMCRLSHARFLSPHELAHVWKTARHFLPWELVLSPP